MRRLHLRLERANEHVNQLHSRLASQQGSCSPTKCADQPAAAQAAQHAQQLEIESLRRQLESSQAGTSSSGRDEELAEAKRAQQAQGCELEALRRRLEACQASSSSSNSSSGHPEVEILRGEVAALQSALAQARESPQWARQPPTDRQADYQLATSASDHGQSQATNVVDSLSTQDWSLDTAPADWQRLAMHNQQAFCRQLSRLQQEFQQQRATVSDQSVRLAEQSDQLTLQGSRLMQAASDLADKAAAMQHCSDQVVLLQSQLTDSRSVTSLQSEQLAVLQAEVNQLRGSLATAEQALATADSSTAGSSSEQAQALQQEVASLKSKLQVLMPSLCAFVWDGYVSQAPDRLIDLVHKCVVPAASASFLHSLHSLMRCCCCSQRLCHAACMTRLPACTQQHPLLQESSAKVAQADARVHEQQDVAREAFQQASAHARGAQQAEGRCQVLEQAVQRAERRADSLLHLQQVGLLMPSLFVIGQSSIQRWVCSTRLRKKGKKSLHLLALIQQGAK